MDKIIIDTKLYENLQVEYNRMFQGLDFQKLDGITAAMQTLSMSLAEHEIQYQHMADALEELKPAFANIANLHMSGFPYLVDTLKDIKISILNVYQDGVLEEEKDEVNQTNEKIITEIFLPDTEKKIDIEKSPIITLSPVNEQVLKYLSEHPEELYKMNSTDFEIVMAEIYTKLGYDVKRTQSTRDGGKDIIIRKPEAIGDFIYYVDCKKYAPKRPVGVGWVRNLVGTVNTDRVNGGILATTSFFTRDARKFVLDNNLDYQIKMQDYFAIQELLNKAIK